MPADATATCAHEGCNCTFTRTDAYKLGNDHYCDQACAEGAGCDHPGCLCGRSTADVEAKTST